MGGAVSAHDACAVEGQHHGQFLQGHVMNHLVVGALQKRGVDGDHRLQAFTSQACCKGECMLLGNANIVVTVGEAAVKLDHA